MNRDYLISKIAEQLKDKKIERGHHLNIEWQIIDTLKGYFDEADFQFISVEKWRNENLLYIRYKNHYLFGLTYTKRKGESHYRFYKDYTDYYYKDFSCADQSDDFDLKKKIDEIEFAIIANEEHKQKEFDEMLERYNQIKALFGDKTDQVLNYIERHKYSLKKGELGA